MSYIFPPSLKWLQQYKKIASEINAECEASLQSSHIDLSHIGSTAIPNLFAKNCIDILAVVDKLDEELVIIQVMEKLGFSHKGEYGVPGRHYFSKNFPEKVHLHLFNKGADEIDKHIHFVNVMNTYPNLVTEFNYLKLTLVAKYPTDKKRYQYEKQFFYEKIQKITI